MGVKNSIKRLIPPRVWGWMHNMRNKNARRKQLMAYQRHYDVVINQLKTKNEPLNVLFMAIYGSNWKYDSVYQMMLKDPVFSPIILVCPDVDRGREHMIETMNNCCKTFEQKGYEYVRTYDDKTDTYIDAHSFRPDIIFYTNPYDWLIDNRYYIDKFSDSLTCYCNYAFHTGSYDWQINLPFHQRIWRYFVECESNKKQIELFSPIKGENSRSVGYPMYDAFTQGTAIGYDWKIKDTKHKRIIWSPHHTISIQSQLLRFSTFELYYDVMWNLAQKYKEQIQIVFKPHPLLKEALYRLEGWGKERTDAYYEMWSKGENTAFVEGEYVDLFNSSDAMINDSGSFTIEYLYMRKPCLYLNNYNRQKDANEVALQAFDCWYHTTTAEQIEEFVKDVVLGGQDYMKDKREEFYKDVLLPPNGRSVAENIINEIKRAVHK